MRRFAALRSPFGLVALLLVGCHSGPNLVGRVELPAGVQPPKNLARDLPPPPPLDEPSGHVGGYPLRGERAQKMMGVKESGLVEGVCRYDASGVGCWDFEGKPSRSLAAVIRNSLRDAPAIDTVFGKKNRLVIVHSEGETTDVTAAHSTKLTTLPLRGKPCAVLKTVWPSTAQTGEIQSTRRLRFPEQKTLMLQKGASVRFGAYQLTVASIQKLKEGADESFYTDGKTPWRIVLTPQGFDGTTRIYPVDGYPAITTDWKRASVKISGGKETVKFPPKDYPVMVTMTPEGLPEGSLAILIDQNPSRLTSLTMGAERLERTDVSGIPLDPLPDRR